MNTPGNVSHKLTEELQLTAEELTARVDKEKEDNPQAMLARMNAGLLYHASDPHIQELSLRGKSTAQQFNRLNLADTDNRKATLESLLATYPRSATIMAPLTVDYGHNIHIGENVFINFDAIFLDICPITIGNDCQIGPRAQFLAALHPMDNHALRASGWEYGAPITIGDNVWLGGGVTICPGVSIGNHSVIGAGSVVTRDIPDHCFAAGAPAKVIRKL